MEPHVEVRTQTVEKERERRVHRETSARKPHPHTYTHTPTYTPTLTPTHTLTQEGDPTHNNRQALRELETRQREEERRYLSTKPTFIYNAPGSRLYTVRTPFFTAT
jgi:hypothetical protein